MPFPLNEVERFAKVHHSRDLESVFQALACRDLQPIDLCVLLALVSHMDRVGRARVTATAVASQLNIATASCIRATSRLRKQKVIVKIRDPEATASTSSSTHLWPASAMTRIAVIWLHSSRPHWKKPADAIPCGCCSAPVYVSSADRVRLGLFAYGSDIPEDVVAAAEAALAGVMDPAPEESPATLRRARTKKGQFQADDPLTPDANEAYEE